MCVRGIGVDAKRGRRSLGEKRLREEEQDPDKNWLHGFRRQRIFQQLRLSNFSPRRYGEFENQDFRLQISPERHPMEIRVLDPVVLRVSVPLW